MRALGYTQTTQNPDLLVNYTIYQDRFSTSLLETYQASDKEIHSRLRKHKLNHGSIYVSLFCNQSRQVVWRGFSNGYSANPRIVKAKTYEIMDHYDVLATPEEMVSAK